MTVTGVRPRSAAEVTREAALQLGFAWHCVKGDSEGQCDEAGNDRAEYASHMKGHGLRAPKSAKPIRLRKSAPAATMRKLEVSPFKWLRWTEEHREPGTCTCGHLDEVHRSTWQLDDGSMTKPDPGCNDCGCTVSRWDIEPVITTAARRGQFWSAGSKPHTFWVLPFEAAPWEPGRPVPVMLGRQWHGSGYEVAGTGEQAAENVRRAENVRKRGVFSITLGHDGPLVGYYRVSTRMVHADTECAAGDGWSESHHQPYGVWRVVDVLAGRAQAEPGVEFCPRCVMLGED
jgi:hypothetical protein